jgi:hypothetical protein
MVPATDADRRWDHRATARTRDRPPEIGRRPNDVLVTLRREAGGPKPLGHRDAADRRKAARRGSARRIDRHVTERPARPAADRQRDDPMSAAIMKIDPMAIGDPGGHPSASATGTVTAHAIPAQVTSRKTEQPLRGCMTWLDASRPNAYQL